MERERFEALLKELDGESLQTLITKNARYSSSDDALHNFRAGGDIFGGTPAQACWGYLTKHLVALRDMVQRDDFSNLGDFLEKCQDSINYIRFLWCIGNERAKEMTEADCSGEDAAPTGRIDYVCKRCGWKSCWFESEVLTNPDRVRNALMGHIYHAHGIDASVDQTRDDIVQNFFEKETK